MCVYKVIPIFIQMYSHQINKHDSMCILCVSCHNNNKRHLEQLGHFVHHIHGESEKSNPQRVNNEAVGHREL